MARLEEEVASAVVANRFAPPETPTVKQFRTEFAQAVGRPGRDRDRHRRLLVIVFGHRQGDGVSLGAAGCGEWMSFAELRQLGTAFAAAHCLSSSRAQVVAGGGFPPRYTSGAQLCVVLACCQPKELRLEDPEGACAPVCFIGLGLPDAGNGTAPGQSVSTTGFLRFLGNLRLFGARSGSRRDEPLSYQALVHATSCIPDEDRRLLLLEDNTAEAAGEEGAERAVVVPLEFAWVTGASHLCPSGGGSTGFGRHFAILRCSGDTVRVAAGRAHGVTVGARLFIYNVDTGRPAELCVDSLANFTCRCRLSPAQAAAAGQGWRSWIARRLTGFGVTQRTGNQLGSLVCGAEVLGLEPEAAFRVSYSLALPCEPTHPPPAVPSGRLLCKGAEVEVEVQAVVRAAELCFLAAWRPPRPNRSDRTVGATVWDLLPPEYHFPLGLGQLDRLLAQVAFFKYVANIPASGSDGIATLHVMGRPHHLTQQPLKLCLRREKPIRLSVTQQRAREWKYFQLIVLNPCSLSVTPHTQDIVTLPALPNDEWKPLLLKVALTNRNDVSFTSLRQPPFTPEPPETPERLGEEATAPGEDLAVFDVVLTFEEAGPGSPGSTASPPSEQVVKEL